MTQYARGRAFEYRVKKFYESKGFFVVRSAGSHSPVDLIAFHYAGVWFIQCKLTGKFSRKDSEELCSLARKYHAIPVLATNEGRVMELKIADEISAVKGAGSVRKVHHP